MTKEQNINIATNIHYLGKALLYIFIFLTIGTLCCKDTQYYFSLMCVTIACLFTSFSCEIYSKYIYNLYKK